MTAMNPAGGAAIPVSIDTTRRVKGGAAIPVYGYASAPTDGRPAQGGAAQPVRVLTAADLKQNGGMWTLEGRPYALPVYTAPATARVLGGPAIAVYPINAWPPSSAVPAWAPTDLAGLMLWIKADVGTFQDAAKTIPALADTAPVWTWADQSGNGNDFISSTVPILKLAIKNGRSVIRFDGATQWYQTTGTMSPQTVFIVGNLTGLGNSYAVDFRTGVNDSYFAEGVIGGYWTANYQNGVLKAPLNAANVFTNDWRIHTIVGTNNAETGQFSLLARYTGVQFGSGDVGEVLVYNSILSAANRALVESYLNTRWAVY